MGEDIDNWDEGEGIRSLVRGDGRKRPKDASVRCVRGPVGRARKRGTLEDVKIGAWGERVVEKTGVDEAGWASCSIWARARMERVDGKGGREQRGSARSGERRMDG